MTTPRALLDTAFRTATDTDPLLAPSSRPGFDYQANFAMKLAKQRKANPRELAQQTLDEVGTADGLIAHSRFYLQPADR